MRLVGPGLTLWGIVRKRPATNYVTIDKLTFDPDNPRLPDSIDPANRTAVIGWLLAHTALIELMASIGNQGFLVTEPLMVVRTGKELVVIEGNRRLAACVLLDDPAQAPTLRRLVDKTAGQAAEIPEEVPVVEFGSREEVLAMLGYRHITGIREWGPQAKARFVRQLFDAEPGTDAERSERVARGTGATPDHVLQMLVALAVRDAILDAPDSPGPEDVDLGVVSSALNHEQIRSFIGLTSRTDLDLGGLDRATLGEVAKWMFVETGGRTQLGQPWNVPTLARAIETESGIAALRKGATVEEAEGRDGIDDGTRLRVELDKARQHLGEATRLAEAIDELSDGDIERITELRRLVRSLQTNADAQLADS